MFLHPAEELATGRNSQRASQGLAILAASNTMGVEEVIQGGTPELSLFRRFLAEKRVFGCDNFTLRVARPKVEYESATALLLGKVLLGWNRLVRIIYIGVWREI